MRYLTHIVVGNSLVVYDADADAHYVLDITARRWNKLPDVPAQELSSVKWEKGGEPDWAGKTPADKPEPDIPTGKPDPNARKYTTDEEGMVVEITDDPNKKKGIRYDYTEEFSDFWKRYRLLCVMHPAGKDGNAPNPGNKQEAYKTWQELSEQEQGVAAAIIDQWIPAAATVPYCETYLRNKLWGDSPEADGEPSLRDMERELK